MVYHITQLLFIYAFFYFFLQKSKTSYFKYIKMNYSIVIKPNVNNLFALHTAQLLFEFSLIYPHELPHNSYSYLFI